MLENVELVFCDSLFLYEQAIKKGLSRTAPVLTMAPALCQNPAIPTISLSQRITADKIQELSIHFESLCLQIQSTLEEEQQVLLPLVNQLLCRNQNKFFKGACLTPEDFQKTCCLLNQENSAPLDWEILLNQHPHVQKIAFPIISKKKKSSKFLARLKALFLIIKSGEWPYFFYNKLKKNQPSSSQNALAVLRNNPLIDGGLLRLLKDYYWIRLSTLPKNSCPEAIPEAVLAKKTTLMNVIIDFLTHYMPTPVSQALGNYLIEKIYADFAVYYGALEPCYDLAKTLKEKNVSAVLSNILKYPSDFSFKKAINDTGIKLISFQHGFSREISDNPKKVRCISESAMSDIFICYTHEAEKQCNENPFSIAQSMAVGLPPRYLRLEQYRSPCTLWKPKKWALLYASTALYAGDRSIIRGSMTDDVMCDFESAIVENVLSQVPHSVCYKTYPQNRYLDHDPTLQLAHQAPNIFVYTQETDLSHLFGKTHVLITSRATSTLGWCLMTNLPLVFINIPSCLPILPSEKTWHSQSVFFFEAEQETFFDELKAFLSKPIKEIIAANQEKIAARQNARKTFFKLKGKTSNQHITEIIRSLT